MSHLPHLSELVAAAAALLRRTPPADLPYPSEPVPPDWFVLETRWDCQNCAGVQPAVVRENGFRCLTCQAVTITTYA